MSIHSENGDERILGARQRLDWWAVAEAIHLHPRFSNKFERLVTLYLRFELGQTWSTIADLFGLREDCVATEALEVEKYMSQEKRRLSQDVRRTSKSIAKRGRRRRPAAKGRLSP